MDRAVVLLSGGIDSAVAAAITKARGLELRALAVDYGQRHRRELDAARNLALAMGIPLRTVAVPLTFLNSSLTDAEQQVPEGHYADAEMANTIVPYRNLLFIVLASMYAHSIQAQHIIVGAQDGRNSLYPDCKKDFFGAAEDVLDEAFPDLTVQIETPLYDLDKKAVLAKAIEHNVPLALTWTCYNGRAKACGKCGACVKRLEAFALAGMKDPVEYE